MSIKSIYKNVAKSYGVSVAEVKRDMQAAIKQAYQKPDKSEAERAMQKSLPCSGKIPTPEEFILFAAQEAREKL
ncbi:MAG: sporulation initiation factor Spo0A [Clostridiales bacterium]|jgi:hypothetical protein|nr:sporulation initiation factor Spo0A [Clostridiales bacterium]